jgi:pyridoxamine 5'-phosphate oxidase
MPNTPLRDGDLALDPLEAFRAWFEEARAAGVVYPEAAALATATPSGRPSARMVLVKQVDERGLGFHTNVESRKADELDANPQAALLFHWQPVGRQVRVEGVVERVSDDEAERYFRTRPRASQIAAWASPQSRTLAGRQELDAAVDAAGRRFEGGEVPLPPHWGGYRLRPDAWELWQHGDDRLHDRFRYTANGEDSWRRVRLAP